MSNFAQMKRMAGRNSLEALTNELNKFTSNTTENTKDDRFWQPGVDKAGNGYAVVRFLPAPDGEDVPFVRVFSHAFKGPTGSWYIENSLTTVGKTDPVGEYNTVLWNSGLDSDKQIARSQKRKLTFISNIYVVSDPANPENEGKVFLYKYGKRIFDKLNEAMNPQFADEDAVNPFDLWSGANFKIKIRQVEGYRNYDRSEFASSEPLSNDDSELEQIWKKEHSLKAFLDSSNFKSYDELKSRLNKVLGINEDGSVQPAAARANARTAVEEEDDAPWKEESPAPSFKSNVSNVPKFDDDDDGLEFFSKLAKD